MYVQNNFIQIYTRTQKTHTNTQTHIQIHTHIHTYVYIHTHTHTHTKHTQMHKTHIQMHTHTYTRTHTYAYTHAYTHIHIRAGGSALQLVRPNLILSTNQLNAWAADNFTTSLILFLLVIVYCCKSNRSKNHTAMVFIT